MLFRSIKRVAAWQFHKIGHWLDPADSYHFPEHFQSTDDPETRVLALVQHYQPMPWANLLQMAQQPAIETRDAVTDLIDKGVIQTTSYGLIIIERKEDHD